MSDLPLTPMAEFETRTGARETVVLIIRLVASLNELEERTFRSLRLSMSASRSDEIADALQSRRGAADWSLDELPDSDFLLRLSFEGKGYAVPLRSHQLDDLAQALRSAAVAARMGPALSSTRN